MKCGTINCNCGQQFYFETNNTEIACIKCNNIHDTTKYPEKIEEPPQEEGESNGVDI